MIGLIIITNGNLALELKSAMEHIIGTQSNVAIFCTHEAIDLISEFT